MVRLNQKSNVEPGTFLARAHFQITQQLLPCLKTHWVIVAANLCFVYCSLSLVFFTVLLGLELAFDFSCQVVETSSRRKHYQYTQKNHRML